MTATWDDEKIARLVKPGGMEGLAAYGLWWRMVEIVARQMDGKQAECSVTYDVSRWSLLLSVRGSLVRHWVEKMAVTGVLTAEWDGSELTVTIPNLLKYRDEYSKKSGHSPAQRTDTDTDTDKKKPPNPLRAVALRSESAIWFEDFWRMWPVKQNRAAALKAALKVAKPEDRAAALVGLAAQRDAIAGMERPIHASTWLNGRRWEDEPSRAPQGRPGFEQSVEMEFARRYREGSLR